MELCRRPLADECGLAVYANGSGRISLAPFRAAGLACVRCVMSLMQSQLIRAGCRLVLVLVAAVGVQAAMPPKPAGGDFLHDYAAVIPEGTQQLIREHQAAVFQANKIPIVVVTVPNLGRYDLGTRDVEAYTRTWFNTWGIGSQKKNDGMLILVSVEERRARIELGAEWGRRWDEYAQQVMNGRMVPRFKAGDYGAGLLAGVEALERMAVLGPEADPPAGSALDKFLSSQVGYYAVYDNPLRRYFAPPMVVGLLLAGALVLVLSLFLPQHRKLLLKIGLALIGIVFLFWIVVVIVGLVVWYLNRGRGDSSDGGFDGGSSGGGGATGEW